MRVWSYLGNEKEREHDRIPWLISPHISIFSLNTPKKLEDKNAEANLDPFSEKDDLLVGWLEAVVLLWAGSPRLAECSSGRWLRGLDWAGGMLLLLDTGIFLGTRFSFWT